MDHLESRTRYPSLSLSVQASDEPGIVMIDGLDVVDEQVVVLSPLATSATGLDAEARTRRHRRHRQAPGGDGYALG